MNLPNGPKSEEERRSLFTTKGTKDAKKAKEQDKVLFLDSGSVFLVVLVPDVSGLVVGSVSLNPLRQDEPITDTRNGLFWPAPLFLNIA